MNVLSKYLKEYFPEIKPRDFYRFIFPAGSLEKKGEYEKGKYCGIFVAVTDEKKPDGKYKTKRYSITDDLEVIDIAVNSDDFCLCAPLSYAGKQRTAENARMVYAIAVDVDRICTREDDHGGQDPIGLRNLIHQTETIKPGCDHEFLPRPTFIVSSGSGLHLYYVLEDPLPLYDDIARELQDYKRELTACIWNDTIVNIKDRKEVQQEGIYQGFRMIGTRTKNGDRVRAFLTGTRVDMEYMNRFVQEFRKAKRSQEKEKKSISLLQAAEKWPEWYERKIVNCEKGIKGAWHVNRAVYDWWLDRIRNEAAVGHRYYCVMILAMYAKKCGIYDAVKNPDPVTYEELERDAYGLIDTMDKMTTNAENHFTAADVQDALESYQERWVTYPRKAIEYRSGLVIMPGRRNKRTQELHLGMARNTLEYMNKQQNKTLQGRKDKAEIVTRWRKSNPNGRKIDCIRETKLSSKTVAKWWDGRDENERKEKLEAIKKTIMENRKIQLEAIEKMTAAVADLYEFYESMPNGEEKEKLKKQIEEQEENIKLMKRDFDL